MKLQGITRTGRIPYVQVRGILRDFPYLGLTWVTGGAGACQDPGGSDSDGFRWESCFLCVWRNGCSVARRRQKSFTTGDTEVHGGTFYFLTAQAMPSGPPPTSILSVTSSVFRSMTET